MFTPELDGLKDRRLIRTVLDRASAQGPRIALAGKTFLNFASNDYLGLAAHPAPRKAAEAALRRFGTGAGASRLLSGGCRLHEELESAVSAFKGTGAALLFTSGYSANTGMIPALASRGDALFSDELNHASLIDGCRLSRAGVSIYRHRDTEHLERLLRESSAVRKIVVTDTVFSMHGDTAPLLEIHRLCIRYGAMLYLDDAHGTGVLGGAGGAGKGALAHFGLAPAPFIIQMGTFSKALGSLGAFAAADSDTVRWLTNSARSFIYSTALPPAVVAASHAALEVLLKDGDLLGRLWRNRERLFGELKKLGLDTGSSETPIIPLMMKDAQDALQFSARLLEKGLYAPAIRPPTVPVPLIRLAVTAAHTEEDIGRLIEALGPE
jgi:8-amino-7-oxononanoate synthase